MARVRGIQVAEEYALRLSGLANHTEEAVTAAIQKGAGILADAMRRDYEAILGPDSTGQMLESMGITQVKMDKNGWWNAKIGFDGYDARKSKRWPKGVPNQLKARVLESGTKDGRIKKHEIIKKALRANRDRVEKAMEEELDQYFEKYLGGI